MEFGHHATSGRCKLEVQCAFQVLYARRSSAYNLPWNNVIYCIFGVHHKIFAIRLNIELTLVRGGAFSSGEVKHYAVSVWTFCYMGSTV